MVKEDDNALEELYLLVDTLSEEPASANDLNRQPMKVSQGKSHNFRFFWVVFLVLGAIVYLGSFYMLTSVSSIRFSLIFYSTTIVGIVTVVYSINARPKSVEVGRKRGSDRLRFKNSRTRGASQH